MLKRNFNNEVKIRKNGRRMFKTIFHPNHAKGGGVNIDLPQLQSIRRTVYIKLKHSLRLLVFCQNLLIFQNANFTKSTGICDL